MQYWVSIFAPCQIRIIIKQLAHLQRLCAIDELCRAAFVGPDEMGELVDAFDTNFHWYHLFA